MLSLARRATLLLLLCAACERQTNPPLNSYVLAIADALCESTSRCFGNPSGDEACRASSEGTLANAWEPLLADAITQQTLSFDSANHAACVSAMASLACERLPLGALIPGVQFRIPSACRGSFVGKVALGAACRIDLECAGDAYCDTTTLCPGVCTAPIAEHQPCLHASAADCQGELECDERSYTCEQPVSGGAGCNETSSCPGPVGEGGACNVGTPDPCAPFGFCEATAGATAGTCVTLPHLGEDCATRQFHCAAGLNCDYNLDTTASACAAIQNNGGPCVNFGDCYSGDCNAGACRPPPCQIVP